MSLRRHHDVYPIVINEVIMFYLTFKFHDNRVNTFGFMYGGGLLKPSPPLQGPGTPKKPRWNRVDEQWSMPLLLSLSLLL